MPEYVPAYFLFSAQLKIKVRAAKPERSNLLFIFIFQVLNKDLSPRKSCILKLQFYEKDYDG
jgi:hypothetical protein